MRNLTDIPQEKELIFVYNVHMDLFSRMTDFAHKIISPKTYGCSLCKLTYGTLTMQWEWAQFIKALPYQVRFQYKDQWNGFHKFPLILLKDREQLKIVLSPEELNSVHSLQELINLLKEKLER